MSVRMQNKFQKQSNIPSQKRNLLLLIQTQFLSESTHTPLFLVRPLLRRLLYDERIHTRIRLGPLNRIMIRLFATGEDLEAR
jgi:hypothetical protein